MSEAVVLGLPVVAHALAPFYPFAGRWFAPYTLCPVPYLISFSPFFVDNSGLAI